MRRFALIACVVGSLSVVAVAVAQQATPTKMTLKASGTASSGGSKSKPVPVGVTYSLAFSTPDGTRPESEHALTNAWGAVVTNGRFFPTCTADQIDAAQSDAKCPKGSLVASGHLDAVVAPDNDFSQPGIPCSKDVRIYNAGQGKVASLLVGPGAKCAGVGYTAPFPGSWNKKYGIQGGEGLYSAIPQNVGHPLPGILGSIVKTTLTFKKLTVKVKGVTRGYLESIGCKGQRKYSSIEVGDPSNTKYSSITNAGKC